MFHRLLWRYTVLLTVCVSSSNHRDIISNQYDENFQISVGPSVCLSLCPAVGNANKNAYFFIVDRSIIIIHISCERD